MDLLLAVLVSWLVLSVLGVLGTAAVCRAGHAEDVARGFAGEAPDPEPPSRARVPSPRVEEAREVTHG